MKDKHKTFIGSDVFPLDMLRYDQCWPRSQVDVNSIYESIMLQEQPRKRQVTVISASGYYNFRQWAIFGWVPWDAEEFRPIIIESDKE